MRRSGLALHDIVVLVDTRNPRKANALVLLVLGFEGHDLFETVDLVLGAVVILLLKD